MTFTKLVFFVLATLLSVAIASGENPWKTWERDLHRQCPANHVEWIADASLPTSSIRFHCQLNKKYRLLQTIHTDVQRKQGALLARCTSISTHSISLVCSSSLPLSDATDISARNQRCAHASNLNHVATPAHRCDML
jgi:hypothetical protein